MFAKISYFSSVFLKLARDYNDSLFDKSQEEDYRRFEHSQKREKKQKPATFKFDLFKQIDKQEDSLIYAESLLPKMGGNFSGAGGFAGSSRMAFDLGGDKVLKIAYNKAGYAQNFFEARLSDQSHLFTKVFDMHPSGMWIVSEKLRPFKSASEFEAATGLNPELIFDFSEHRFTPQDLNEVAQVNYLSTEASKFLSDVVNIILKHNLILGDTSNPLHWGINPSGKTKLYDYGLDSYLFDKHLETVNREAYKQKMLLPASVPEPTESEEFDLANFDPKNESLGDKAWFI